MNRRTFLKAVPAAPMVLAAAADVRLKVSLNAYLFNKLLNDAIRKRGPGVTLMELVDFCAKNKSTASTLTAYFMPG